MVDNGTIAELLIREAEGASGHRELAFRRAAREAFMWPEEAETVAASGRSLSSLPGLGPPLARALYRWIESPPKVNVPPIRSEFLTLAAARRVLAKNPKWRAQLQGDRSHAGP